ncbi:MULTISPECIES: type II toxin-antitoxin system RnlB family antitoxin [unclassified Vibrio]|uniref:type II toxin-antitoxin system RnlB family antitoxin n=1 Tax=unclassified Vibrio TaxID=2614977 RepID=UPI0035514755
MNYKVEHSKFGIVISSVSYESPLHDLPEIELCLNFKHYVGEVVFDLLCSNGDELNRFVTMSFDGSSFNRRTLSVLSNPPEELLTFQNLFYSQNKTHVSNSVLSSSARSTYTSH